MPLPFFMRGEKISARRKAQGKIAFFPVSALAEAKQNECYKL
jgi:hypothetical protein